MSQTPSKTELLSSLLDPWEQAAFYQLLKPSALEATLLLSSSRLLPLQHQPGLLALHFFPWPLLTVAPNATGSALPRTPTQPPALSPHFPPGPPHLAVHTLQLVGSLQHTCVGLPLCFNTPPRTPVRGWIVSPSPDSYSVVLTPSTTKCSIWN